MKRIMLVFLLFNTASYGTLLQDVINSMYGQQQEQKKETKKHNTPERIPILARIINSLYGQPTSTKSDRKKYKKYRGKKRKKIIKSRALMYVALSAALLTVLPEDLIPCAQGAPLIPLAQGTTSSTVPFNHSYEENKWGWLKNSLPVSAPTKLATEQSTEVPTLRDGSQVPSKSPTLSHFSIPDIQNAEYLALVAELLTNP